MASLTPSLCTMQTLTVRSVLNGTLYSVPYQEDAVPSVNAIRTQLEPMITEGRRNHVMHLLRRPGKDAVAEFQPLSLTDTVSASDELVVVCEVERRMTDQECAAVEDTLIQRMSRPCFLGFQEGLIEAGAVVAGGSICAAFGGFPVNDIDVYVPYSRACALLRHLDVLGFSCKVHSCGMQVASEYDQSFFRKNHILVRFALQMDDELCMDVMVIPDDVPVEDVVTNFDLSFCEVWWDGRAVYAADPYGLRHMEGVLKPDYRHAYFAEHNRFIHRRLKKYSRRGFTIHTGAREFYQDFLDDTAASDVFTVTPTQKKKRAGSEESWAVKFFLRELYSAFLEFITRSTGSWISPEERAKQPPPNPYRAIWHYTPPLSIQTPHHPLNTSNRIFEVYFLLYPGMTEPTYAAVEERLGTEFVRWFAFQVNRVVVRPHLGEPYVSLFQTVFPDSDAASLDPSITSCHVMRQIVVDIPLQMLRLLKEIPGCVLYTEDAVAVEKYQRRSFIDEKDAWSETRNTERDPYSPPFTGPLSADFFEGCSCEDCSVMRPLFSDITAKDTEDVEDEEDEDEDEEDVEDEEDEE